MEINAYLIGHRETPSVDVKEKGALERLKVLSNAKVQRQKTENKDTTAGLAGSHASGDIVRPSHMKAEVAERGTKRHEIGAGNQRPSVVGGC
ncbi:MAG: hypothetical protein KGH74_05270, partial [Candidatus Micrarchaeota archaeon]|nr:hypothetical protein [Candidatus Micrarchaeota archaeon]